MPGRRTKLTPEVHHRLTQAIAVGSTYRQAAHYAGITVQTLGNWLRWGEAGRAGYWQFFAAIKQAEGEAAVRWLLQIDQAAAAGSWQAAAWKLERRYPEEYGRRVLSGPEGGEMVLRVMYDGPPPLEP